MTGVDTMQGVYETARTYVGLHEYPGAKHNPEIVKMFAATGNAWVKDDETPWCAAFVGAVLAQCGIQGTGQLNARSYLAWGEEVPEGKAERGDVVVLWRGSKTGSQGHVAFLDGFVGDKVRLLGGNQGDAVNTRDFPKSRILSIRAARPKRASVSESKTVQASAVQVATGASAMVTGIAALNGTAQLLVIGFAGIIVLSALWVMRERLRKWAAGDR